MLPAIEGRLVKGREITRIESALSLNVTFVPHEVTNTLETNSPEQINGVCR
jgi:hypothetical protein